MSTAAGDTTERYHLERRIGSGAFGTVYLARDLFLEEDVAVKMPIHQAPDLLSTLQEPRLLHRVRDPNIVELRDIWLPREQLIITVETGKLGPSLRVLEWDGPHSGPYRFLRFNEVPGNTMPLPPVALWRDLHDLANVLFRKLGLQSSCRVPGAHIPPWHGSAHAA